MFKAVNFMFVQPGLGKKSILNIKMSPFTGHNVQEIMSLMAHPAKLNMNLFKPVYGVH